MQETTCRLTVFFEGPFWVGVLERFGDGQLEVCKITFGAEPKDGEVHQFLLQNWHRLRFSSPVKVEGIAPQKQNPKRVQREIKRQLSASGVGTKAQQALKEQQAEGKAAARRRTRQEREEEQRQQFELRQRKRKEKHRGH